MRYLVLAALLVTGVAGPASAQGADTARRHRDEARRRIEERFGERVREQLGLNTDQAARLRTTAREYGGRRRTMEDRERELRRALAAQLRPGVAADQDSVADLTRALVDLRVSYAESWRDEMEQLAGFLTPVQRAQLYVMRERLLEHAREIHEHRGWRRRRAAP